MWSRARLAFVALGLALAGLLVAGGVAACRRPRAVAVEILNTRYYPETLRLKAGTTVTWVNKDPVAHSVVQGDWQQKGSYTPLFSSGDFTTDQKFQYTFAKEGTYRYFCDTGGHYLLGMVGTIEVTR